jgi:hypothetical protein
VTDLGRITSSVISRYLLARIPEDQTSIRAMATADVLDEVARWKRVNVPNDDVRRGFTMGLVYMALIDIQLGIEGIEGNPT